MPLFRRPLRDGQALTEFAVFLPLMLLLMLVAVDFGRLFFSYIEVNNAAREAANYAAANAQFYQSGTKTAADFYQDSVNSALSEANVQSQTGAGPLAVSSPSCFTPGSPPTSMDCKDAPQTGTTASGIGNQVSVTVVQQFTFLTPGIGTLFGGPINLTATATATVLNPLVAQVLPASPSPGISAAPSSAPSAAPSAAPSSAPSSAPSAAPTNCTVPNFFHLFYNGAANALQAWQSAGFTGTLVDNTGGHKIQTQTGVGGSPTIPSGTVMACIGSMQVNQ